MAIVPADRPGPSDPVPLTVTSPVIVPLPCSTPPWIRRGGVLEMAPPSSDVDPAVCVNEPVTLRVPVEASTAPVFVKVTPICVVPVATVLRKVPELLNADVPPKGF